MAQFYEPERKIEGRRHIATRLAVSRRGRLYIRQSRVWHQIWQADWLPGYLIKRLAKLPGLEVPGKLLELPGNQVTIAVSKTK